METATDILLEDHKQILRLEKVISKCFNKLYAGKDVPLSDIEIISGIIDEFIDLVHYAKEEDSYFPCVSVSGTLNEEIRKLMIEHEFSRRIAVNIQKHLNNWKRGTDSREPVARFLRTYSIYLKDHMSKEELFFKRASTEILTKEEEYEMFERFNEMKNRNPKLDFLLEQISFLENSDWYRN